MPRSLERSIHKETILAVQSAALKAVEPGRAVRKHLDLRGDELIVDGVSRNISSVERIRLVGAGKAVCPMASAVVEILVDRLTDGLVIAKRGHAQGGLGPGPVEVVEASHPLPDSAGVDAAARIAGLAVELRERDLMIAVIAGGTSSLLTAPANGLTLDDLREVGDLLLRSGANIREFNAVRKHLSAITGGRLAELAAPASMVCLALSDVVGDAIDAVGSGPTAPDPTTFADAWSALERYRLSDRVPASVREHLLAGVDGRVAETPKPGNPIFDRVQNAIVGSNRMAAEAAVNAAGELGLSAALVTTSMEGEAREVAKVAASLLREVDSAKRPVERPACLVLGGETTVTVNGGGKGGRNQELALSAAIETRGMNDVVVVSLATDGNDGPTDAAGAVATGETASQAAALGLDPVVFLNENDSYRFFDALGDLISTGPTLTNVGDLVFLFAF